MTLQLSHDLIFGGIFIVSWLICARALRIKRQLTAVPLLTKESICLQILFFSAFASWMIDSIWYQADFYPWVLMFGTVLYSWSSEPNNEGFWRKKRNVFSATIFLSVLNVGALVVGLPAPILAIAYIFLILRRSQNNMGEYFRLQSRDFSGVQQKLAMIESSNHNKSLIDSQSDEPQRIDKAV